MRWEKARRASKGFIGLLLILALGLFTPTLLYAGAKAPKKAAVPQKSEKRLETTAEVSKRAVAKEEKKAEEIKEELNKKAIEAVAQTYKALDLLAEGKSKEALEILKKVIGELEIILAANKKAAFVPINTYHVITDIRLSPEEIETEIKKVRKLLHEGDVQEARLLLNTLQSEINIIIEQLPLATYPDAIKLASKYIINDKVKEAESVLSIALNSMVLKTIVIPLPLVKATELTKAASKSAKKNKDNALKLLEEAKKQLKIAQVLGYGRSYSDTYKDLKKKIEAIQKEIKGKNKAEKLFEELIIKLKEFKTRLQKTLS